MLSYKSKVSVKIGDEIMNEDTRIILEELKGMRSDISELKSDVSELKTDVSELKTDVSDLKSNVAELKTDVATLKNDMTIVKLKIENEIQPAIRVIGENHLSLHEKIDYLMADKKATQFQIDLLKVRVSNLESKIV